MTDTSLLTNQKSRLITECCRVGIWDDERYCRRCGWEARVQFRSEYSVGEVKKD